MTLQLNNNNNTVTASEELFFFKSGSWPIKDKYYSS